jgi:hypothetical protein
MSLSDRWNSSPSKEAAAIAVLQWEELRNCLRLVIGGLVSLLGLGAAGIFLLSRYGKPAADLFRLTPEKASLAGWGLIGLGAILAYGLMLLGVWRSVAFAPTGYGVRKFTIAALLAWVGAAVCGKVSHFFFDGAASYAAFRNGTDGLARFDVMQLGAMLQVSGVFLLLLSVLLFSASARALALYFGEEKRARWTKVFFWYAAFLIGATVGILLRGREIYQADVLAGLAAGWVGFLVWYALVIHGAGRCLARAIQRRDLPAPRASTERGHVGSYVVR